MKKYFVLIKHNIDFILLDLLALVLGYYATVELRYLLKEPIWHGELFVQFGVVVVVIYVLTSIFTQSYRGIMQRGFFREAKSVLVQMVLTWAIFTVTLYMVKNAQNFSRSVYCTAAVLCTIFIYFERVLWKGFVRNSRHRKKLLPGLLIVADSDKAQEDVDRMLAGAFFNQYQITGIVLDEKEKNNYHDRFQSVMGLENLDSFIYTKDIQDAYVDISDAEKEKAVIDKLLANNIVVHRSLGDSTFDYQEQTIGELSGKSVITVSTPEIAYSKRVERFGGFLWKRLKGEKKTKKTEEKSEEKKLKVCLVGSSGGHLTHLYMLKPFWQDKDRFWVTFDKEDAKSLLENERMIPCFYPTNRSIPALIKNTKLAFKVLKKERPDLIISTGAAVAVPFFYVGKLYGAKCIYVEVFDRIDASTITGKMVYPIADKFIVQWEEMKQVYPKAVNLGSIF